MAPSSAAKPYLHFGTHLSRANVFQTTRRCRRCRAGAGVVRAAAPDAPPVVRAAVGAVTELLRALSGNRKSRAAIREGQGFDPRCGSVEDVVAVLQDDYRRAYFLTGMRFLALEALIP
ncbi:hypothetical protein ACP70R_023245 [Stipagrostis hirtigluma subsp. patula]